MLKPLRKPSCSAPIICQFGGWARRLRIKMRFICPKAFRSFFEEIFLKLSGHLGVHCWENAAKAKFALRTKSTLRFLKRVDGWSPSSCFSRPSNQILFCIAAEFLQHQLLAWLSRRHLAIIPISRSIRSSRLKPEFSARVSLSLASCSV